MDIEEELKPLFLLLADFDIADEELNNAKGWAKKYPEIENTITSLEELKANLKEKGIDNYISFELGMISNYEYYTGIIFD